MRELGQWLRPNCSGLIKGCYLLDFFVVVVAVFRGAGLLLMLFDFLIVVVEVFRYVGLLLVGFDLRSNKKPPIKIEKVVITAIAILALL